MKQFFPILFSFISCLAFAQELRPEIHCKHFFYGYPYGTPPSNDLIIRDNYALANNDFTKFADWVTYKLTTRETVGHLNIERN